MMWLFLVSDTFIFTCFLVGYLNVRRTTTDPWPYPSEVFALELFGHNLPLILIAIMTFVLITSSGTMAMAVRYAHFRDKKKVFWFMAITAFFGATFVGMQVFEWSKLISEGVRPWGNPFGAPQFGSIFFMVTGFHGLHVSIGVIYLLIVASKVRRGHYDKKDNYEIVEITGLYWHFVDLVWVFIFAFFYLW
ncbi:cytochrome c oxidase subunit 3 [Litorivicinus sp.]|nr:cytochrome c oxidase subunit 3 [Litorivicinus sp.]